MVLMRIPLTKYGLPEVAVYPAVLATLMAVTAIFGPGRLPGWALVAAEGVLGLVLVWALLFFRDPERRTIRDDALLLAPADGRVADVEQVDEADLLGGPALRIGIFLSVFNTHINRAPCDVRVEKITYRPRGLSPEASSSTSRSSATTPTERRGLGRSPRCRPP